MATTKSASQIIVTAIKAEERSQLWVSKKTGIPLTTLRRKLDGHSDFSLSEVARIAFVLGVAPCELLPDDFRCSEVQ